MPPPRPPPELMADLVADILLRIPPDEPADLFRSALVCKPWRRIIFDPAFPRRYREFHRTPPLLGFFHDPVSDEDDYRSPFVALTTASPYYPLEADYGDRIVLDCRHGRVLFYSRRKLIVWDPITNEQYDLCHPDYPRDCYKNVAVLCAADGCDHLDCRGRPFLVVCVASDSEKEVLWWSVYSSETRTWSALTSLQLEQFLDVEYDRPNLLAGDALYFILEIGGESIIKYDLTERNLSVMDLPDVYEEPYDIVLTVENGELGFACLKDDILYLWSWQTGLDGVAGWVQQRAIELKMLLTDYGMATSFRLNGFVESKYTIFVSTDVGVFTIELKSELVKKVAEKGLDCPITPYMSFWTPDLAEARLSSP
ncbi:hypothetical protein EJB05_14313 [Eragrostis curvula]|uniref:F-box protein AT5G49610-like beta-propeller domain-containing protein n=1 Tax=Eragrostis curvula TaxID=38414 RepID=A0A5J9VYQ6_9POAL|nr:hypothetical protein EJB05_14313 [Eragrostis curvula]